MTPFSESPTDLPLRKISPAWRMPSNSRNTLAAWSGSLKCFRYHAVPFQSAAIAAAVRDDRAKAVHVIVSVGRADRLPLGVVECQRLGPVGLVLVFLEEFPIGVEVVLPARRGRRSEFLLGRGSNCRKPAGNCHREGEPTDLIDMGNLSFEVCDSLLRAAIKHALEQMLELEKDHHHGSHAQF